MKNTLDRQEAFNLFLDLSAKTFACYVEKNGPTGPVLAIIDSSADLKFSDVMDTKTNGVDLDILRAKAIEYALSLTQIEFACVVYEANLFYTERVVEDFSDKEIERVARQVLSEINTDATGKRDVSRSLICVAGADVSAKLREVKLYQYALDSDGKIDGATPYRHKANVTLIEHDYMLEFFVAFSSATLDLIEKMNTKFN